MNVQHLKTPAKVSSFLLALLLVLSMMQLPAFAQDNSADTLGTSQAAYAGMRLSGVEDDGKADEQKVPKQVNVHMGNDPSTQVNITYTTVAEAATQVVVNEAGSSEAKVFTADSVLGQGKKYVHGISVTGLSPYTDYEYTVGYGENTYSGTFRTAPAQGSKETIKFAYMADTQVSNATNAKALGATLNEVNNIPDLDFVYIAGDITDTATNETQWELLFNNSGMFPNGGQDMFGNNLLAVTQGNHDNNVMYSHINAPAQMGNIVYAFDYGPVTMVVLNLETARSDATAREAQKEFLVEAITEAQSRGQWTAVGFHKSMVTGASHITDSDVVEARKYWLPLFAELDVDMVLQGHDHVYSRGFVTAEGNKAEKTVLEDGTVLNPANAPLYVVGGHAGGLKWYSKKNYTAASGDPIAAGYSFLDVNSTDGKDGKAGSDVLKEQVIVEVEVSDTELTITSYMFKYDTDSDTITTEKYEYDSVTVRRDGTATGGSLSLKTDAHLVKKGEYFRVDAAFKEEVSSNAAILNYTFDTDKFEYRGFTESKNMTVLDTATTADGVKLTVMIEDYKATDLGQVLFSANEDADLKNADSNISLDIEYVVRDSVGNKVVETAKAKVSFTTSGGNGGSGEDGEYTLIDLSNVIDMFGADTTHANWDEYRFYDANNNGVIDIFDISTIAKQVK